MRLYEVTTPGACPRTKATECSCESLRRLAEAEQPIKAVAVLGHGDAKGIITFVQKPGKATIISGSISGLTEGLHGFHIHEFGDLSDGCDSAGGHYNPHGVDHGDIDNGHVGDLGNIQADSKGVATFKIKSKAIQLQGATSIVGRAVVVHEDQDDLGKGGDEESLKTGNAGNRAGCGVITLSELTESAIADLDKNISDKHFSRKEMPQVKEPDLIDNEIPYKKGKISIANIKPVQTDRVPGLAQKVAKNFYGKDKPFIIDVNNYLVNGHHRYDAARLLGIEKVDAIKVNVPIELLMKQFSHTTSDTMVEHLSDEASTPEIHNKALQMAKDAYRKSNKQVSFTALYDKALEILEPAKVDEYGVPDYNTMPTYKLKKAHKGKQKFFLPSNEPTPKGVQAIENVTDYPEITQSKKEEIINAWEYQEDLIDIGNGYQILSGENHGRADNIALLIGPDYKIKDEDDNIKDLLDNNFGIIQGENFADGKAKMSKPQFDVEWDEAQRYPEFKKLGKDGWIKLASKGKATTIISAKDINNTDAADVDSFKTLDPQKQKRATSQLKSGNVEMPIVAVYSDGYKELIGGNTRLTAMMRDKGQATVWQFEVPDEILDENFADGKKKGKSRPGRVKRSGASCKGSVTSLRAKAKKYSGERAKMYHWCANMKSGKKKTNEDMENLSPSAKLAGEYIDSEVKSGKIKNLDDLKRYIVELRLSRIIDHAEDARALWIHHLTVNPHNLPDAVNESAFENLKLPTWMSHTSLEKSFAQEYGPRYGDYVAHMDLDSDDDLAMNASGMGDMAFEMVKANDIKVMQKFLAQMPVQFTVDDLRLDDGIQVWHLVQQNKTVH